MNKRVANELERARWLAQIAVTGASWGVANMGVAAVLAARGDFIAAEKTVRALPAAVRVGMNLAALRLPTFITPTGLIKWVLRGMPVSEERAEGVNDE